MTKLRGEVRRRVEERIKVGVGMRGGLEHNRGPPSEEPMIKHKFEKGWMSAKWRTY